MGKYKLNKYEVLSKLFLVISILLSDIMCWVVGYSYCNIKWGMKYEGWSASPSIAFIYMIPFGISILLCIILYVLFNKK